MRWSRYCRPNNIRGKYGVLSWQRPGGKFYIKLRVLILRFHAELRFYRCSSIEHQGTFIAPTYNKNKEEISMATNVEKEAKRQLWVTSGAKRQN